MKDILLGIFVVFFILFGTLLALTSMYAAPDRQTHILEASYFWLGDSVVLFGLFYYFKK